MLYVNIIQNDVELGCLHIADWFIHDMFELHVFNIDSLMCASFDWLKVVAVPLWLHHRLGGTKEPQRTPYV